ncbi:MAG: hypothetical protein M3O32_13290, partial [Actinomycetota bacterium]|nr:hypothetical protein [Actinomycetota bacterium]
AYTVPRPSPTIADAAAGSAMVLDGPVTGNVTSAEPPPAALSTTSDESVESNSAASPVPASGRTDPSGGCVTAGETAARADGMVGGGLLAGLVEQAKQATIVTTARAL